MAKFDKIEITEDGRVLGAVYHEDGTMDIVYVGKVDPQTGKVIEDRYGVLNNNSTSSKSTSSSSSSRSSSSSSSTSSPPIGHSGSSSHSSSGGSSSSSRSSTDNLERPPAYSIIEYNGKYYAYSPIADTFYEATPDGKIKFGKKVDPSLREQLLKHYNQTKSTVKPEKEVVVETLEGYVGSVGYVKNVKRVKDGVYQVETNNSIYIMDTFQDKITIKDKKTGKVTFVDYDPKQDKVFVEQYKLKVETFEKEKEQLQKQIEQYNKKVEEFNKKILSLKNPTKEQLKQLQLEYQSLVNERNELEGKIKELELKRKELLMDLPKFKALALRSQQEELLTKVNTERLLYKTTLESIQMAQEDIQKKKKMGYEYARAMLETQKEFVEESLKDWRMNIPMPWATTTARTELTTFAIGTAGLVNLQKMDIDPEVKYFAEKYYREMASNMLKDVPKEWEKSMWYDTGIQALGIATGFTASSLATKISPSLTSRLGLTSGEYLADVLGDVALQKSLFGDVDWKSTLLFNAVDFTHLPKTEVKTVKEKVKVEEFKFKEKEPHFNKIEIEGVIKGTDESIKGNKENIVDVREYSRYAEDYDRLYRPKVADVTEEVGFYNNEDLLKRVQIKNVREDFTVFKEEIKPPKKIYEIEVKLQNSKEWQPLKKIVIEEGEDFTKGFLLGEIEVEKNGKKIKAKVEEPIEVKRVSAELNSISRVDVLEGGQVEVHRGRYKGELLEVKTSLGEDFYEFQTKEKYGKKIIDYKKFEEKEKGTTVVYDPKKKQGFGIDPLVTLEEEKPKTKEKVELGWFFGEELPITYKEKTVKPRAKGVKLPSRFFEINLDTKSEIESPLSSKKGGKKAITINENMFESLFDIKEFSSLAESPKRLKEVSSTPTKFFEEFKMDIDLGTPTISRTKTNTSTLSLPQPSLDIPAFNFNMELEIPEFKYRLKRFALKRRSSSPKRCAKRKKVKAKLIWEEFGF